MPLSRARIYGFYFPKKAFTPSHDARFRLISKELECEGLKFKAFTPRVNAGEGLKHQAFPPEAAGNQEINEKTSPAL